MNENILIVEDEFIVANDLRIMLQKAGYKVCGIAPSVAKAMDLIKSKSPDWILLDIFLQGDKTGIDLAGHLIELKIPFIYISANTNQGILEAAKATQPYGFLVKPFREKDLLVMLDIAQYRHQQSLKYNYQNDSIFEKQITLILNEPDSRNEKLKQVAISLQAIIPFDFFSIGRADTTYLSEDVNLLRVKANSYEVVKDDDLLGRISLSARDLKAWKAGYQLPPGEHIYNGYHFRKMRMDNLWIRTLSDHYKYESLLIYHTEPIAGQVYRLSFLSTAAEAFTQIHYDLLNQSQKLITKIITDIVLNTALDAVEKKQVTAAAQPAPHAAPQPVKDYHGIVGNSPLLLDVFRKIELVAPDSTSILILGESGTGKERIAHTIHQLSPRKNKPMVTVNCAALPLNLIESELFGHEKGAFTGAHDKRIGKFEQADGGSIFLDEIGELPLEAQVKLLRVLQEKEIERLGGSYIKKINVRIITATNRNLEKEVAEGRFRLDLYYRLNVFPIELPALRQRREDIILLARHFMQKYAKKSGKAIDGIAQQVIDELMDYEWPGNIRELEHLIERSVLLTAGSQIEHVDLPAAAAQSYTTDDNFRIKTMEEMERDHILSILKLCKGKIFGPGGAAELLNIPSTTLNSKIKKLGIKYEYTK